MLGLFCGGQDTRGTEQLFHSKTAFAVEDWIFGGIELG